MNHNENCLSRGLWFLVAFGYGKTSGDGFEGVMRIESPRPADWARNNVLYLRSMMLGYACTLQHKSQPGAVTAQDAEPQSADLLEFSFVALSKSYV